MAKSKKTTIVHQADSYAGQQLRSIRRKQKLTQSEIGKTVGISHQQIQKYESGSNRMTVGMVSDLAAALCVPAAAFFEERHNAA